MLYLFTIQMEMLKRPPSWLGVVGVPEMMTAIGHTYQEEKAYFKR